jgi:hypothetical protein
MFVRVATLVAAAVGAAAIGVASPAYAGSDGSDCPPGYYPAASGDCVPDPKKGPTDRPPTAICQTATTPIANTHTQAARATATAAWHKC